MCSQGEQGELESGSVLAPMTEWPTRGVAVAGAEKGSAFGRGRVRCLHRGGSWGPAGRGRQPKSWALCWEPLASSLAEEWSPVAHTDTTEEEENKLKGLKKKKKKESTVRPGFVNER